jgi:hypothetical protein
MDRATDVEALVRVVERHESREAHDAAAPSRPSAASTSSSCVFGEAFGITWTTVPSPSMMNVERSAPQ